VNLGRTTECFSKDLFKQGKISIPEKTTYETISVNGKKHKIKSDNNLGEKASRMTRWNSDI
jgi:hypothetical protein